MGGKISLESKSPPEIVVGPSQVEGLTEEASRVEPINFDALMGFFFLQKSETWNWIIKMRHLDQ